MLYVQFDIGAVVQNNYEELWNILNYAVPGSLGERKEFVNYYAEPLKKARQLSAKAHVLEKVQSNTNLPSRKARPP